jgi:hypothetical protein
MARHRSCTYPHGREAAAFAPGKVVSGREEAHRVDGYSDDVNALFWRWRGMFA